MATKREIIDDVILRITKGKPSDDMELEPLQVAFWIDSILPALIKQALDSKFKEKGGDGIDPAFICYERQKALKQGGQTFTENFYIDLDCDPINLYRDRGVIRVATEATATEPGDWVDKMKMEEIDDLRKLKHSKPSLKNLKYHRVKNRLWFHGLTDDTYQLTTFLIAYVPKPVLSELDDDDPIYMSEDLLPLLSEEVEKIARRQTYQSDSDEENDSQQDLAVNGQ